MSQAIIAGDNIKKVKPMRLSEKEINNINSVITSYLKHPFDLRLYGSRLDDHAKGGDIDLLLIIDDDKLDQAKWNKHILLANLKQELGDQKIDLTISSEKLIQSNSFLSMIFPTSQKIN